MNELAGDDTSALLALNLMLGAVVAAGLVAIVVAALRDWFERRRMRGALPDAWPPTPDRNH